MDDAARANLGFKLSEPNWLTDFSDDSGADGPPVSFRRAAVKADLTNAAAEIPALNLALVNRAGVPGVRTAHLRFGDRGPSPSTIFCHCEQRIQCAFRLSFRMATVRIVNISLAVGALAGLTIFAHNIEPLAVGVRVFAYRIDGQEPDATLSVGDKKKTTNGPPPAEVDEGLTIRCL